MPKRARSKARKKKKKPSQFSDPLRASTFPVGLRGGAILACTGLTYLQDRVPPETVIVPAFKGLATIETLVHAYNLNARVVVDVGKTETVRGLVNNLTNTSSTNFDPWNLTRAPAVALTQMALYTGFADSLTGLIQNDFEGYIQPYTYTDEAIEEALLCTFDSYAALHKEVLRDATCTGITFFAGDCREDFDEFICAEHPESIFKDEASTPERWVRSLATLLNKNSEWPEAWDRAHVQEKLAQFKKKGQYEKMREKLTGRYQESRLLEVLKAQGFEGYMGSFINVIHDTQRQLKKHNYTSLGYLVALYLGGVGLMNIQKISPRFVPQMPPELRDCAKRCFESGCWGRLLCLSPLLFLRWSPTLFLKITPFLFIPKEVIKGFFGDKAPSAHLDQFFTLAACFYSAEELGGHTLLIQLFEKGFTTIPAQYWDARKAGRSDWFLLADLCINYVLINLSPLMEQKVFKFTSNYKRSLPWKE